MTRRKRWCAGLAVVLVAWSGGCGDSTGPGGFPARCHGGGE
jgi:hypothetical protein